MSNKTRIFKKVRLIAGIVVVLFLIVLVAVKQLLVTSAYAATWNFDEGYGTTTTDSSSNSYASTVSGAVWRSEDFCFSGKCLYFDGSDDYVSTSSTTVFDAGSTYTIMAWIRPTFGGEAATETFMSKTGVVDFNISDTNDNVVVAYTGGTTASSNTNTILTNRWNHIAITHNGSGTFAIYVNGVDQTSDATATDTNSAASTLFGSETTTSSTQSYQGFIDFAKVYSTQLTASQIKAEYNSVVVEEPVSGAVGSNVLSQKTLSDGLAGYWKLDESSGNASDSSGNALTLTNNGTTTYLTGMFGNGSEHVPASSQYLSTATTISGLKTVSFWVNPDSNSNYYISLTSSAYITSSSGTLSATGFTSPTIYVNGVISSTITADVWSLVTITSDTAITADSFYIGRQGSNYFDGTMDDVRVYNRVLSANEIISLNKWAPGPTGYWKMDERTGTTIADSSSNGNTSSAFVGNTTWTNGKFGSGLTFDGTNDQVLIPESTGIDVGTTTSSYTVSAWFKTGTATAASAIVSKDDGSGAYPFLLYLGGSGENCFLISDNTNSPSTCHSTVLNDNAWHYVTGVRNVATDTIYIYIDGILRNSATDTTTATTANNDDVSIGANAQATPGRDFTGEVDEVKIYNYARTARQIIEDMNASHPLGGSPVGSSVLYYRFDEATENTCSGGTNDVCNSGSQGSTFDGTSTASRTTTAKVAGQALDFDGTDDVVTVTNSNPIDYDSGLSTWTFSAWVNPDSDGEADTGRIYDKSNSHYFRVDTESGGRVDVEANVDRTTDTNVNVSSAIPTGSWSYVAATWDGTTLSVYINGILRGSSSSGSGATAADGNLLIGGSTSNNFDGKLDEVKLYGVALTASEIQIDYNFGSSVNVSTGATAESAQSIDGTGTSPVIYWNLDENTGTSTVYDRGLGTTSANNGSMTGFSSSSWLPGKIGSALKFNGSSTYISLADTADLTPTTLSTSVWVKLDTLASTVGDSLMIYEHENSTNPFEAYSLYQESGDDRLYCKVCNTSNTCVTPHSEDSLTTNTWYHAACTWDGTTVRMYLNGVFKNSSSLSGSLKNGNGLFTLGAGDEGTSFWWPGMIDDFKLYGYTRTDAQIMYDYNRGGPIGWWKFDECTGSTANDSAGYGSSGTITLGAGGVTSVGTCSTSSTAWGNGAVGRFNASLDFDGTDDYVTMGDVAMLDRTDLQDFSISGWFYRDTATTDDTVIAKRNGIADTDDGYIVYIDDSTDKLTFEVSEAGGTDEYQIESTTTFTTTGWNHFVITFDQDSATNSTIYINGKPDAPTKTGTIGNIGDLSNAVTFRTGTESDGGNPFDGKIDDVRFYNYGLSAVQARMLFNNDSPTRFGPLQGTPTP